MRKRNEMPTPTRSLLTEDSFDSQCNQVVVVGRCRAELNRFAYFEGDCRPFVYGGCGGNDNNFETMEECRRACFGEE